MNKFISIDEIKFLEKYFSAINILFSLKERSNKNPAIKIINKKNISILKDISCITDNKLINNILIYPEEKQLQIFTLEDDEDLIIDLEELKESIESETTCAVACIANSFYVDFDEKDC